MFIQYQKERKPDLQKQSHSECYASHENFALAEVTLTEGMLWMDPTLWKDFLLNTWKSASNCLWSLKTYQDTVWPLLPHIFMPNCHTGLSHWLHLISKADGERAEIFPVLSLPHSVGETSKV